jgi:hypothetical protein
MRTTLTGSFSCSGSSATNDESKKGRPPSAISPADVEEPARGVRGRAGQRRPMEGGGGVGCWRNQRPPGLRFRCRAQKAKRRPPPQKDDGRPSLRPPASPTRTASTTCGHGSSPRSPRSCRPPPRAPPAIRTPAPQRYKYIRLADREAGAVILEGPSEGLAVEVAGAGDVAHRELDVIDALIVIRLAQRFLLRLFTINSCGAAVTKQ